MSYKVKDMASNPHYALWYVEYKRDITGTVFGGLVALSPGDYDDDDALVRGAAAELGTETHHISRMTLIPNEINNGNRPRIPSHSAYRLENIKENVVRYGR